MRKIILNLFGATLIDAGPAPAAVAAQPHHLAPHRRSNAARSIVIPLCNAHDAVGIIASAKLAVFGLVGAWRPRMGFAQRRLIH